MFRDFFQLKLARLVILAVLALIGIFAAFLTGLDQTILDSAARTQAARESLRRVGAGYFVLADDKMTNLRPGDVRTPVYDRYSVAEREVKGLPVQLPPMLPTQGTHIVYLTFDDGPDDKVTPAILDTLKQYGVPATFFVTGAMSEAHPEVLKRIFAEHHAIGNHTYDHDYDELYPDADAFLAQVEHTDEVLLKLIGVRPFIVRAPGGTWGMFTDEYGPLLTSHGYVVYDWNVSSQDATGGEVPAEELVENVESQSEGERNVIVLMHSAPGKETTAEALPEIITYFLQQGYTFGVLTPMTPHP